MTVPLPSPFSSSTKQPDFLYGDDPNEVVIYRLIGNDMPPLQSRGQLRWNTEYALTSEPHFQGAHKRWILNRIWNATEFELIYEVLIENGVARRDIISRCFDIDDYMDQKSVEDKLLYLTSQNEGRNSAILDGKYSGFEWSVILDGNTFMSKSAWLGLKEGLRTASDKEQQYLKIPYHRVHSEQEVSWLNQSTTLSTILRFAPTKGESQMAFHKTAKQMFSLGKKLPLVCSCPNRNNDLVEIQFETRHA